MFLTPSITKFSKKIASVLVGAFFIFTNLVIPINAAVYPGNPGTGATPGAYGSYDYSFCFYNNNDDLECFDSANPQLSITKEITDPSKLRLVAPTQTTVPYRLTITNISNPPQTINTFHLRDYLPDAIASIGTPVVASTSTASTTNLALTNSNKDMVWTGSMTTNQTVVIEFTSSTQDNLSNFINRSQTNTACVSHQPMTDGNTSVFCNSATFQIVPDINPNVTDLLLNKTVTGTNSFEAGDTVEYKFTVTNTGTNTVTAFNINENATVDSRSVWPSQYLENITSATVSPGSASVNNNVISVTGVSIGSGQSVTVTANARVRNSAGIPGENIMATNRACVQTTNDSNRTNDCASANISITTSPINNPQLGIEKQIVNNNQRSIVVSEGGTTVPYRLTISNSTNPPRTISEFYITDVLPPATTGTISNVRVISGGGSVSQIASSSDLRWQGGSVEFGDSVVIEFDATLQGNLASFANTTQRNIACVQLTQNGRNEGCHYDDFVITTDNIPNVLDLELFKGERDGKTSFTEGETITYEFIVTNNSNVPVSEFVVNDLSLPNQFVGDITSVSLKSGDRGSATLNNQNNNVTGLRWNGNGTTLGFGQTITFYATATVKRNLNLTEVASAQNRACVEHASDPSNGNLGGNNCHNFTVNITPNPIPRESDITIQKEVVGSNIAYKTPTPTGEMKYRLKIGNAGDKPISPQANEPMIITEQLPSAITLPIRTISASLGTATLQGDQKTIHWYLPAGEFLSVGEEFTIDFTTSLGNLSTIPDHSVQVNTATVTYENNRDDDNASFTVEESPNNSGVDLHLEKTADQTVVAIGDTITYRFTITNTKGQAFNGEVLINESQWPSAFVSNILTVSNGATLNGNNIRWNGTIPASQSVEITATAKATALGTATNIAVIENKDDDNDNNNEDQTTITVVDIPESDITIQKEVVGPSIAYKGPVATTSMKYRLIISNTGDLPISPTQAEPVIITEQLPSSITLPLATITSSPGTATLQSDQKTIHWYLPAGESLPVGGQTTIEFVANLGNLAQIPDDSSQVNTARVDYKGNNDDDNADFTVRDTPEDGVDLRLQKTTDKTTAKVGDTITYRFTITNTKGQAFNGEVLINESQWPSAFVSNILTVSNGATLNGNNIRWNGTIPASQSVEITATAKATALGTATNIAVIENKDDDNDNNDQDQTTVTILQDNQPNNGIGIQKTIVEDSSISRGSDTEVSYQIVAGNNTSSSITSFTIVEEQWPAVFQNITGITASKGSAALASNGRDINWTGGNTDFAPGETVTITFTGVLKTNLTASDNGVHRNIASITHNGQISRDDGEFTITEPNGNPRPDLSIQKEVQGDDLLVNVGETVDYIFTITNNSATNFQGRFRIAETWPSEFLNDISSIRAESGVATREGNDILWDGSINARSQVIIRATATVKNTTGRATNIATIKNPDGSAWNDDISGNNSDQTTVIIQQPGNNDPIDNVEKILNGNLQSVAPNATVTFTAQFTNNSQQTISKVTMRETATNFTINTITSTNGAITGNGPYTWTGTLKPSEVLTVTITGTVANLVGQNMQNRIVFEDPRNPNNDPIVDPDPNDNEDITTPVPITSDPIDNVTKTVNGNPTSILNNEEIRFTSTVTNRSGKTITKYTITETTSNFRITEITANSGSITGSGPYSWTGTLLDGQTLTLTIKGTVTGVAGNNVVNIITFSDARDSNNNTIPDTDTSDNTAQTPNTPIRKPTDETPKTGGAIAIIGGILGATSLAGAGYYFLRKRGGFKLVK